MDMQKITSEILATGLTQKQLSVMVPCTQGMISNLLNGKRGKNPGLTIGNRLLTIHSALCSGPKVTAAKK